MRRKQNKGLAVGLILIIVGIALIVFVLILPSPQDVKENETDLNVDLTDNDTSETPNEKQETVLNGNEQTEQPNEQIEQPEQPVVPEEEPIVESPEEEKMTVDTSLWNLILVNPDNSLPENYTFEKEQVQGNYYLDSRAAPLAKQMIADAKEEGIELQICSSIRDVELQTRLFNNKINDLIEDGYSEADARVKAATIVAVPGTSEHHTGLALDIVTPSYQSLNAGYENTDAAKWLKENAAKYGFILRYPKDKTEITKIIFEPWHYRYVGQEYAEFIMSEGICFEEFIETYGVKE